MPSPSPTRNCSRNWPEDNLLEFAGWDAPIVASALNCQSRTSSLFPAVIRAHSLAWLHFTHFFVTPLQEYRCRSWLHLRPRESSDLTPAIVRLPATDGRVFPCCSQRNVAQCFHPDDMSALAALHFAVNELKVEAIIVCGEYLVADPLCSPLIISEIRCRTHGMRRSTSCYGRSVGGDDARRTAAAQDGGSEDHLEMD